MQDEVEEILKDRQLEHGDADVNFATIGRIWGALLHTDDILPHEVALMMTAFKTVRAFANPTRRDSWNDIEGYAKLGKEILN